ncbi:MAG: hypothetical protein JW966_02400 [Anaerolineae bacterium]|nr:hypothetical protein [Anaerolineae bacterium]
MDIFKWMNDIKVYFRRIPLPADQEFEFWIKDALSEEAARQPPIGAWERLCKTIADRRMIRGYGMWVLDEVSYDSPAALSTMLTGPQYEWIGRLYVEQYRRSQVTRQFKDALWLNMNSAFLAVVNL